MAGTMLSRTKISVSLPVDLVDQLDRSVRGRRFPSRSAAIEDALRQWQRGQRDEAIEAYYRGRTDADRKAERAWGALGAEALRGGGASRAAEPRPRRRSK
jgi:Arc/MetJ-type ribon-helix-helix transcriptional regulator